VGQKRLSELPAPATSDATQSVEKEPQVYSARKDSSSTGSSGSAVTKTVNRGDTLFRLIREVYDLDEKDPSIVKYIELVRQHNPQIRNTNIILADQQIIFPKVPENFRDTGTTTRQTAEDR
jgi:nucleoid-associated protein YgaU